MDADRLVSLAWFVMARGHMGPLVGGVLTSGYCVLGKGCVGGGRGKGGWGEGEGVRGLVAGGGWVGGGGQSKISGTGLRYLFSSLEVGSGKRGLVCVCVCVCARARVRACVCVSVGGG